MLSVCYTSSINLDKDTIIKIKMLQMDKMMAYMFMQHA